MDLRRQVTILRAWFPLLIAVLMISGLVAFAVSNVLPKSWEGRATLIVGQSLTAVDPDYNQVLVAQRLSTTYAVIATTRPVLERVIDQLDLTVTADELARHVRASAPLDSTLLTVTAEDRDPARAAAIANAVAEELVAASPALQGQGAEFQAMIDEDLRATRAQIDASQARSDALLALAERTTAQNAELQTLTETLITLRSTYATLLSYSSGGGSNLLDVVEPAVAASEPVSPRPLLNTALAAVLGLLVAVGLVFAIEYLDDRVRDGEAVQALTGFSTLGTVTRMRGGAGRGEFYRLATLLYPRSAAAEAYRTIRTNVEFASIDQVAKSILVTSSLPGEGKTITAANLAISFAQAGRSVLLIDADLRQPGIHRIFDVPNTQGLTTLLRGDTTLAAAVVAAPDEPHLQIMTSGPLPSNPAELLGSARMRNVLGELTSGDRLVIFDSPPLQAVADSAILSSIVDGTILVVDARRSRRRSLVLAREALARAGARVWGVVLNRAGGRSESGSYYGGYAEPVDAAAQPLPHPRPPAAPAPTARAARSSATAAPRGGRS